MLLTQTPSSPRQWLTTSGFGDSGTQTSPKKSNGPDESGGGGGDGVAIASSGSRTSLGIVVIGSVQPIIANTSIQMRITGTINTLEDCVQCV